MIFTSALVSVALAAALSTENLPLNQAGFYPNAKKIAVVKDTACKSFKIIEKSLDSVFYTGTLSEKKYYDASMEYVRFAEFTDLDRPGTYCIATDKSDSSQLFSIGPNIYKNALKDLIRSFYYQRASMDLEKEYAGAWYRNAGHPDNNLTVIDVDNAGSDNRDVHGGWYDAGDFGKYIVNAGITCGTMLQIFEIMPGMFGDNSLNIPESDNGKSDFLDEIKYELDWMLLMQDNADGGVFFKVGPIVWPGAIMPEDDAGRRYIIGKSTSSTLDFASVMALAGRVFRDYDTAFANKCLAGAVKAWDWYINNPDSGYPTNTKGTGPYEDGSDKTYSDEKFWAATELYISTGEQAYLDSLKSIISRKKMTSSAWWQDVKNLGYFSIARHKELFDGELNKNEIVDTIVSVADAYCKAADTSAYRISMKKSDYTWGSAGNAGNQAVVLAYAHYLTGNQKFLDALVMQTDFLFGKNPAGYSFVTGIGNLSPVNIHHRQSQADFVDNPIPGFVVGGPNQYENGADPVLTEIIESGTPAAKCYVDDEESYASNEVAINQNAPWIFVLAYLEKYADSSEASPVVYHNTRDKHIFSEKTVLIKLPGGNLKRIMFSGTENVDFVLFNGIGKMVDKKIFPYKKDNVLSFDNLINGLYILSINGAVYYKIIVTQ